MTQKSNLEFRKVPSLDFLYEVSEDGRFLRNVKSKKYIKIFLDLNKGCYVCFVNLKNKICRVVIHDIVTECWPKPKTISVKVQKDQNTQIFKSMTQASEYIAKKCSVKTEHVRAKMKKRRKHILGYDITYLNAETGHAGLTGQGTVH